MCVPELFQPVTQIAAAGGGGPGDRRGSEREPRGPGLDRGRAPRLPPETPAERQRRGGDGELPLIPQNVSKLAIRGLRELNARARADLKIPFTPLGPDFNEPITGPHPRPLDPIIGVA